MKVFNLQVTKEKRQDLRNNVLMPERILWKYLKNRQLGYKFRRQHGIGKYVVDFYCPELKLVVEIDGRIHGEEPVQQKDIERENFLKSFGLVVKRFTAEDINNNLENIFIDLKDFCDKIAKDGKPHPASP